MWKMSVDFFFSLFLILMFEWDLKLIQRKLNYSNIHIILTFSQYSVGKISFSKL